MKVKEIMTPQVEAVHTGDTVQHAAARMKELDVGVMPVMDGEEATGVLTDRDIVVRVNAEGLDPGTTLVKDAMTHQVTACKEDDDVVNAAQMMKEKKIRRILVQNAEGAVAGIVSLGDVAVATGKDLSGEVLEKVSEPAQPAR